MTPHTTHDTLRAPITALPPKLSEVAFAHRNYGLLKSSQILHGFLHLQEPMSVREELADTRVVVLPGWVGNVRQWLPTAQELGALGIKSGVVQIDAKRGGASFGDILRAAHYVVRGEWVEGSATAEWRAALAEAIATVPERNVMLVPHSGAIAPLIDLINRGELPRKVVKITCYGAVASRGPWRAALKFTLQHPVEYVRALKAGMHTISERSWSKELLGDQSEESIALVREPGFGRTSFAVYFESLMFGIRPYRLQSRSSAIPHGKYITSEGDLIFTRVEQDRSAATLGLSHLRVTNLPHHPSLRSSDAKAFTNLIASELFPAQFGKMRED